MTLTVGSLCSGAAQLDAAVAQVLPTRHAWFAENDPAASRALAHRHPAVPNLGDITTVNWADTEPVDILTAGFPCQDLSLAGKRAGLKPGNRSGLWRWVAHVIAVKRPPLVVLENVRGLLSARAHSDMEPCPWCVGDDPERVVLRALGAVLGDLAVIGYDATWYGLHASDVGAAHPRFRVFVVATPTDAEGQRHGHPGSAFLQGMASAAVGGAVRPAGGVTLLPTPAARLGDRWGAPNADTAARRMYDEGRRNLEDAIALLPTPAARVSGRGGGYTDQPGRPLSETILRVAPLDPSVALLPTPRATDGSKGGPNQRGSSGDLMLPSAVTLLPTPTVADSRGSRNATAGRRDDASENWSPGWSLSDVAYADRWGEYAPAIARWEHVLGRPAPDPTEPGSKGQPRLAARFAEWFMGWPDGWVTAVPGLTRNDQLRIIGNGVVPQQAAHALRLLLNLHFGGAA